MKDVGAAGDLARPPPAASWPRMRPSFENPEIAFTSAMRVACDGEEGALGHPRVWMQMGPDGFVDCGYCDRRFILEGGPADKRGGEG